MRVRRWHNIAPRRQRFTGHPQLIVLVRTLERASSHFAMLWKEQEVAQSPAWRKALDHPEAGLLSFNYATLSPDAADEQVRFTIYTPSDIDTARKFEALLSG